MTDHSRPTDASFEALSALVDGQARPDELSQVLNTWRDNAATRAAWRDYHLVGDVMRSAELAQGTDTARFLQRLRTTLADEPVVLAPAAARALAPAVPPAQVQVTATAAAVRRRPWLGPAAVAAGFVMVVGAMVSALVPTSTLPRDALASTEPRIHLVSPEADASLGIMADVPLATSLVSTGTLISNPVALQHVPVPVKVGDAAGSSFSRPARASAVLLRDPRLDQALGLRRGVLGQDDSFASPHTLTQQVGFEAP